MKKTPQEQKRLGTSKNGSNAFLVASGLLKIISCGVCSSAGDPLQGMMHVFYDPGTFYSEHVLVIAECAHFEETSKSSTYS